MNEESLRHLLSGVAEGNCDVDQALDQLRTLPYEDIDFTGLDHHRALRGGFPEVVFCAGKSDEQVTEIIARLAEQCQRLLATRATESAYQASLACVPNLAFHPSACCIWLDREPERNRHRGVIVVAAGTSDLPVLDEAALTLDLMGHKPLGIVDVGVAGLHRLFLHIETLQQQANVVVVAVGMDGALPSLVGGLTNVPVITVPTSVGYGASFGGLEVLLSMLNSCASGVGVVNIDNGYGAGHLAALINGRIVDSGW